MWFIRFKHKNEKYLVLGIFIKLLVDRHNMQKQHKTL